MNIENPLKIKKNIIKSPKNKSSKLSAELKRRLSQQVNDTVVPSKPSPNNMTELKKIHIPLKKKSKKSKLKGFIPTNLSETLKIPDTIPKYKPINESNIDNVISKENPMKFKKKTKSKKLSRKKNTKSKTISVKLNDDKNKEKDILNIIDKFDKMDVKDIKEFLEKKGISSKNNNKSKLLPYLYLLTCVDDDINIIKH